MSVLASQIQTRSDEFRANADRMRALVQELREKTALAAQGGNGSGAKEVQVPRKAFCARAHRSPARSGDALS